MNNWNFVEEIISGMGKLRSFDLRNLVRHDSSLPDDWFDWETIHGYDFNYSDMTLTMRNPSRQYIQIDIDTNAFFFNATSFSAIQMSTGPGTELFLQMPEEQFMLRNRNNLDELFDPQDYITDETNFQGSTILDIPDSNTIIQMCSIAEFMKTNRYKIRTNVPYELWQKFPIGEYFDVCSERMGEDYEY